MHCNTGAEAINAFMATGVVLSVTGAEARRQSYVCADGAGMIENHALASSGRTSSR
jgi:hypothetical protein